MVIVNHMTRDILHLNNLDRLTIDTRADRFTCFGVVFSHVSFPSLHMQLCGMALYNP